MGVDAQGGGDVSVAQLVHGQAQLLPALGEPGCVGVAQVVDAHPPQPSAGRSRIQSLPQVPALHVAAGSRVREDEAVLASLGFNLLSGDFYFSTFYGAYRPAEDTLRFQSPERRFLFFYISGQLQDIASISGVSIS